MRTFTVTLTGEVIAPPAGEGGTATASLVICVEGSEDYSDGDLLQVLLFIGDFVEEEQAKAIQSALESTPARGALN